MMLLQFTNPDDVSDERFDASYRLGEFAWEVFQKSLIGRLLLRLLPSEAVHHRAEELFLLGFTARMCVFVPYGAPELDMLVDESLVDIVWEDYLLSVEGKVVLGGAPYPDTPKEFLYFARKFFRAGMKAATFTYNGLAKN